MTEWIQVMTTCGAKDAADALARALVERRLAGCAQVVGPIESVYRWQGKIESSAEWLCLIKTRGSLFAAVEAAICELHSYETPEIIATPIVAGSAAYFEWLADSVPLSPLLPGEG